ncbi:hypothetical protein Pcinc_032033 [Petrolisthes cinctipes]|uniref:Uncharacterized protein n=1 Tax=Petrolisthes cinctipes TaxID=88211 RepID=A0AAE1EVM4_PETCI|nr:hypothetical protein Pcinc_032033 [Petrolisthes cinctipes]
MKNAAPPYRPLSDNLDQRVLFLTSLSPGTLTNTSMTLSPTLLRHSHLQSFGTLTSHSFGTLTLHSLGTLTSHSFGTLTPHSSSTLTNTSLALSPTLLWHSHPTLLWHSHSPHTPPLALSLTLLQRDSDQFLERVCAAFTNLIRTPPFPRLVSMSRSVLY